MPVKILCFIFLFITHTAPAQKTTNVYFRFDKHEPGSDALHTLDTIAADSKIISISISGHCDQLGSEEYNYKLSEQRAEQVRLYLISRGFDESRIKAIKGFGADEPAINKTDAVSRKANRRVTIISAYAVASAEIDPIAGKPVNISSPAKVQKKMKLADEIKDTGTRIGESIVLRNINFYGGLHRFLPTAYPALEDLLEAMQKVPALEIEIQGHICCRQDDSDGIDNGTGEPFLSYNRARAVYEFLIMKGIDSNRMSFQGYGHQYPLYVYEATEAQRSANRRVEIKIVRK